MDTLNPNVVRMEYAVRGPIVQKANQIQEQINEVSLATDYRGLLMK